MRITSSLHQQCCCSDLCASFQHMDLNSGQPSSNNPATWPAHMSMMWAATNKAVIQSLVYDAVFSGGGRDAAALVSVVDNLLVSAVDKLLMTQAAGIVYALGRHDAQ